MELKQLIIKNTGDERCPHGIWKIEKLNETTDNVQWECPVCKRENVSKQTFFIRCVYCDAKCCG